MPAGLNCAGRRDRPPLEGEGTAPGPLPPSLTGSPSLTLRGCSPAEARRPGTQGLGQAGSTCVARPTAVARSSWVPVLKAPKDSCPLWSTRSS